MTSFLLLGHLLLFWLCCVGSSYYASMEKTLKNIGIIFFYRSREQYPMKSVTEMHWGVTKLHSAR